MNSTLLEPEASVGVLEGPRATGLASGALWTFGASIAGAISQWLLVAMTAKLGSAEMVGHLAMSLAIVAPVQALTDLALRPALATDARSDFRFGDYWRLRGAMILLFLAVVGPVAMWRGGTAAPVILVIGLQKAVESASDILYGLFQRAERLRWIGQSVVLRSALASFAFAAVMASTGNLLWACMAGWIVRVAVFLFHDLTLFSVLETRGVRPDAGNVSGLLTASIPLAIAAFLMSVTVNIPRYIVERRMGAASLGIFAALIYLFQVGAILVDALGQASCVRLSRHHAAGDTKAFRRLVMKLVCLAAGVGGCGVALVLACGESLLSLAYSAAFAAHVKTLLWLSFCALPWYCSSVLGYAIVARRQMTALFNCQMASLATTLGASCWFIGGTDLSGACSAVFVAYSIQLAIYSFILWRTPDPAPVGLQMKNTIDLHWCNCAVGPRFDEFADGRVLPGGRSSALAPFEPENGMPGFSWQASERRPESGMKPPLISVTIATYRRRALLEKVIRAVENQCISRDCYEVIVCDSHSGDGTSETMTALMTEFSNLRYVDLDVNTLAAKRNAGVREAKADLIVFLDDDAVPGPDFVARHLEAHRGQERQFVCGNVQFPRDWIEKSNYFRFRNSRHLGPSRPDVDLDRIPYRMIVVMNGSFRKQDILTSVGPVSEEFQRYGGEDYEFGYRVARAGLRIRFAPGATVEHFEHGGSIRQYMKKLYITSRDSLPVLYRLAPSARDTGLSKFLEPPLENEACWKRLRRSGIRLAFLPLLVDLAGRMLEKTDDKPWLYSALLFRYTFAGAILRGIRDRPEGCSAGGAAGVRPGCASAGWFE